MKKKISFAVVLAIILTLLATVSLALGLTGYFENAARLQKENGYYDTWGLAEKQALIASMKENGLLDDGTAAGLKDEAAIDAYLIERYGAQGHSDSIGLEAILEKELGPIDTWSAETKAWYTSLLQDTGLMTSEDVVYLEPAKSPLKAEEIIQLARQNIESVYEMASGTLDQYHADWSYEEMDATDGTRIRGYFVNFTAKGSDSSSYSCALTETGEIIDGHRVTALYSPAQQKALAEEKAGRDEELRQMFRDYQQKNAERLAQAGSVSFEAWPLEDQQTLTDTLRPIVEKHMADNPNYSDALGLFIVSHRYGVPDSKAISREEAVRIAQKALTENMGMSEKEAAIFTWPCGVLYDVTQPDAPVWKIILQPASQKAAEEAQVSLWQRRRVVMNALTGEIVDTKAFTILNGDTEAQTLELTY